MKIIKDNILNTKYGVIAQQVNCRLVMGAGLAKSIKIKYPVVYSEYKEIMSKIKLNNRLGKCQIVNIVPKKLYVANLFGQFNYGRQGTYTDYNALAMALNGLQKWSEQLQDKNFPIFFPYKMGCDLAGGDWKTVINIINNVIKNPVIVKM